TTCTVRLAEAGAAKVSVVPDGKSQLLLLFELTEEAAEIALAFVLALSCTSTNATLRVPDGLMLHCVPGVEERSDSRLPEAPCRVSVPPTLCVLPASNVSVSAAAT